MRVRSLQDLKADQVA